MHASRWSLAARMTLYSAAFTMAGCVTGEKAADAAALGAYAPRSPHAAIKAVSLSSSDHDAFDPAHAGTAFPDTTHQVVVWYRWAGADPAAKVAIHWLKGNDKVLEQGEAFAKAAGSSAWVLKMDAGGLLPTGNYRVELLENGKPVTRIPFRVGAERTATASGTHDTVATDPENSSSSGAPSASAPVDTAAAAPASPAPSPGGNTAAKVQETKWPGIVAEVSEFRRKGNALTAKIRFSNRGTTRAQPDFYYSESYLLDGNNRKYEVLKDDKGSYLAALRSGYPDRWYDGIEPGTSQTIWMKFSAPPASVTTATLQVPGMEPFEDLPIQD